MSEVLGVTVYGLSEEEAEETFKMYDIDHQKTKVPGICARRKKRETGYSDAGDATDMILCWYCFGPGCYSPHPRGSRGSGGSDCDDDAGALILVIIIMMVLLAIIIAVATLILAGIAFLVDILIAAAVGIFDILTFGKFRRYIRRKRYHLFSADHTALQNAYTEIVARGGLPRAEGFWTNWFIGVRMGAVLTIGAPITAATILLLNSGGWLWAIPIGLLLLAIFLIAFGTYSIRRQQRHILERLGPPPKDLPS